MKLVTWLKAHAGRQQGHTEVTEDDLALAWAGEGKVRIHDEAAPAQEPEKPQEPAPGAAMLDEQDEEPMAERKDRSMRGRGKRR